MALFLSAAIAASALLTGCGSAASGSTAASTAASQEVVTCKMVGNNASALSTEAAKKIAALIEEKSNGTLKPELYLEGQLGDNDEDLCTGLSEGNYEMLINAEMLFNWAVPEWMELFNMAFIFENQQHLQKFWESDIAPTWASSWLKNTAFALT